MKTFIKIPKNQLVLYLLLIFSISLLRIPGFEFIKTFLISLFSSIFFELIFLKIRKNSLFFPSSSIISGCIIGLLVSPFLSLFQLLIISFAAAFSKHFLKISQKHIFNPAAFGLVVGGFLFEDAISWLGVSWERLNIYDLSSIIFFFILLSPVLVSCIRMKRFRISLSFLFVYIILSGVLNLQILNTLLDPTILFFSIVMLPEPVTSPNNHTKQVLFGSFVAIVSILAFIPIPNFSTDPLLLSLLIGNLIFFKLK